MLPCLGWVVDAFILSGSLPVSLASLVALDACPIAPFWRELEHYASWLDASSMASGLCRTGIISTRPE